MLTLLALSACRPEAPPPRPPDVLLVVLDTVRADALTPWGASRPTSPQLAALAASGVVFEDATAPGTWTWPSHASLFTGEPPWVHGAHYDSGEGALHPTDMLSMSGMRSDLPTLAERFTAAGYRTVAISANPLLASGLGVTRGFGEVDIHPEDDEGVVRSALGLMADPDERPLLLTLNLFGAHAPFDAQPAAWVTPRRPELAPETAGEWLRPYLVPGREAVVLYPLPGRDEGNLATDYVAGRADIPPEGLSLIRDLYEGEVLKVDYLLKQVVEGWKASGRAGVVAVTADHGEYLGERRMLVHGRTVYPELLHVPLVVVAPGKLPAGQRVRQPVEVRDLHDTLLDLAGVAEGPRSLVATVEGRREEAPILVQAWEDPYWSRAIGGRYTQGWRLYREGDEALVVGLREGVEYYRLGDDAGMTRDVAAEHPERVAALLEEAKAAFPAESAAGTLTMDPATAEALRALGYLGGEDD